MSLRPIFSVSLLSFLSACAVADLEAFSGSAKTQNEGAEAVVSMEAEETGLLQVAIEDFLEQPLSRLEEQLGEPDFIRTEGLGEFRRYDTERCRVYAIISTREQEAPLIEALSVGAPKVGETAPAFNECF